MEEQPLAPGKVRKASFLSQLFANALSFEDHRYGTWCCGFLSFKEDIGTAVIENIVRTRLLNIPRFRSRYDLKRSAFVELPIDEIDLSYHFVVVDEKLSLQQVSDDYVANAYRKFEFDIEKPWWQLLYFPCLEDGKALIISKIAHAIGDGAGQIGVLNLILDEDTSNTEAVMKSNPRRKKVKNAFGVLNKTRIYLYGLFSPFREIFAPPDSFTPIRRLDPAQIGAKKTAFAELIPLQRIKDMKNKFEGGTLNDVMFAVLTMTLRECFLDKEATSGQKFASKGSKVRAGFAVNTRKKNEGRFRDGSPYNMSTQASMQFEMEYTSRIDLVWKVKRELDKIKLSPAPFAQRNFAEFLYAILPRAKSTKLFTGAMGNITAIMSNVPGPQGPVRVGGNEVVDFQFLLSSPRSCYIGILSYNGKVSCGICLDETVMITPEEFSEKWALEFDKLEEELSLVDGIIQRPRSFADGL